jgi:RCR-type E3 ubiquitin transferase
LELIQEVLPHVAALNLLGAAMARSTASLDSSGHQDLSNASVLNSACTTSMHYAFVESEHPYKAAVVSNWKVVFPENVKWMTVEFDPQCGTAQPEDSLQLYVKPIGGSDFVSGDALGDDEDGVQNNWPVLTKFSGANNWPQMAIVLPGNELFFSLETASDYVQDEKATNYGFRCLVVGYEWPHAPGDGLKHLESELAFLGGMCAASLMKKDLQLPPASGKLDCSCLIE